MPETGGGNIPPIKPANIAAPSVEERIVAALERIATALEREGA